MRVFKNYIFNLREKVEFKNTFSYVENFLQQNGYYYENLAFMLEYGDNRKIVRDYPTLAKYQKDHLTLTSVSPSWKNNHLIHVDKADKYIIKEIAHKIPKPYNFYSLRFVFDNIHWHLDINTCPATGENTPNALLTNHHQTNSIELKKHDNYGKKYNLVDVKIEVTNKKDDDEIIAKLTAAFGAPIHTEMVCMFDGDENYKYKKYHDMLQIELEEFILHFSNTMSCKSSREVSCISPKKIIAETIKNTGFEYSGYMGNVYYCKKTNQFNHLFQIEVFSRPQIQAFNSIICLEGYNFHFVLYTPQLATRDLSIESHIHFVFQAALEIETYFSEKLKACFGETPDWFEYSSIKTPIML